MLRTLIRETALRAKGNVVGSFFDFLFSAMRTVAPAAESGEVKKRAVLEAVAEWWTLVPLPVWALPLRPIIKWAILNVVPVIIDIVYSHYKEVING